MIKARYLLALALFFCTTSANAQRLIPIVGGTITVNVNDLGSNFRDLGFQVIVSQTITGVVLSSPIPANAVIVNITFTQNATGGFTVTFGGNITTQCSVTTTANATSICRLQYSAANNAWTDAGGSSSGGGLDQTVSPLSYGAKWDVKGLPNCSWSSGSQTVTCSDGPFTGADAGKIMFGTRSCAQVNINCLTNALDFVQGTITGFTSTTQVTVSSTAGATCPDGSHPNCNFFWGTQDDTSAIQAAENAAWNTVGQCRALQLPAAWAFIKLDVPLFNGPVGNACGSASGTAAFSDLISVGPSVFGQGQQATKLIPLPTSVFTGCAFGPSGTSCMGTAPNLQAHDFSIDGGQAPIGGTHANVLWESVGANGGGNCDGGATVWNMAFSGFGLTSANLVGFQAGKQSCNDPYHYNVNVTTFGSIPCSFFPENQLNLIGFLCFGGNSRTMQAAPGAIGSFHVLNTKQSAFYSSLTSGGQVVDITGGINWNSDSDHIINANVSGTQFALIREDAAGTYNFHNLTAVLPTSTTATTVLLFANASGALNHFDHSTLTATGANNQLFNTIAGTSVFDDCGNAFANGTVANAISGGFFGNCSVTGTTLTAGAIVPSANWGTSAAVSAPFGATADIGFTLTNGSAAVGASPTLTYTFPTPYLVRPNYCTIQQTGGTQAQIVNEWAVGTPTTTSVVFTYNATPTVNLTEFIAVSCH